MFDPKEYDTRMRDPEGKRKKPSEAESPHRHLPREARLRTRSEERFDAKRAEEPLPPRDHEPRSRSAPRTWWPLALLGFLALVIWRFAAGETGQGLILLMLGGMGGVLLGMSRRRRTIRREDAPAAAHRPAPRRPRATTRARKQAPKPAPRPRRYRASPKQTSMWAVIGGVSVVLTLTSGLTKRCRHGGQRRPNLSIDLPDLDERPRTTRDIPRTSSWRAHLPAHAPDRISGAVLFGTSRSVPHVRISLTTDRSNPRWGWTNDHGVFVFDGVGAANAVIEVRGAVDLGLRGPAVARLQAGTRAGRVVVDTRHAFLLRLDRGTGRSSTETATLQVAGTEGASHGEGRWELARDCALVTGLARDVFYDVLVQAHADELAEIVERVAAGQEVYVAVRPGADVHGRLVLPRGASATDVAVVLTHGGLRVEARVSRDGFWKAPCLPQGSWWDVTATRKDHAGARMAFQPMVHAGSPEMITLSLR